MDEEDDEIAHPLSYQFPNSNSFNVLGISPGTGNNNAYCQDNEVSWLNWAFDAEEQSRVRFTQKLTRLRHTYPILRRNLFFVGKYNEELDVMDVSWINANGSAMEDAQWGDAGMRCFGMLTDGRSQTTGIR